jgi:hypothetical protein
LARAQQVLETDRLVAYSAVTREGARQLWDEIQAAVTARPQ